jgi:hypothetical protein
MKLKLTHEQVSGLIRHSLTFVGGILVMKGIVDEPVWAEISGAVLTLVGGIWSIISKL